MSVLQRDFLPDDLAPILKDNGLDGCVAVQARECEEETRWLLELAGEHDFIEGVVGWIDLKAGDLSQRLQSYKGQSKLKGFRHILQGESDDRYMMQPDFIRGVKTLHGHGYTYDILVFSRHLPVVAEFVDALPSDMPLVIDHIAKPVIRENEWQPWADAIARVAEYENVMCKISGMVTEAKWDDWTTSQMQRYISHVINCFGIERIMFGSDWPVCTLAASYKQVLDIVSNHSLIKDNPAALDRVIGDNAVAFYGLK